MNTIPYGVYYCKKQNCPPGHKAGPMSRDHYLVHFVREGQGQFQVKGKVWDVQAGQAFFIFPGVPSWYKADGMTPWSYSWIGFSGPDLMDTFKQWNLTPESPILSFDDSCRAFYYMNEIMESRWDIPGEEWRVIGNLLKIIGEVERFSSRSETTDSDDHVRKAKQFIDRNYTRPMVVSDIVNYVCLERSYFSHLFKEKTGDSPRDFLNRIRMEKAMELLLSTSYSMEIVAKSVGYRDPLHFSRNFKGFTDCSPSEFRKNGLRNKSVTD